MRRSIFRLKPVGQFLLLPALAVAVAFSFIMQSPAQAGPYKVLHSFCSGGSCGDGSQPQAALVMDPAGNLFGTTASGGRSAHGTVFRLERTDTGKLKFSRIYSFCPTNNCTDGAVPVGSLIIDVDGNLYGMTAGGGTANRGVIFKLSPNSKKNWKESIVYNFCQQTGCQDGAFPAAGLTYAGAATGVPYDGVSTLYSTTSEGGTQNLGTAFSLSLSGGIWSETILYDFCSQGGSDCLDGKHPVGSLLLDQAGNLFGTTASGGGNNDGNDANGSGVAFQLTPSGDNSWSETTLYRFCSVANCADGAFPRGSLVSDPAGNLFGTTAAGGRRCSANQILGCGTVFELVPNGTSSQETVLYAFCAKRDCKDGNNPEGGVIVDTSGNVFGTTVSGGGNDSGMAESGGGIAFKLSGKDLQVVHRFCSAVNCADGENPYAGLVQDAAGTLYGTTIYGGAFGESSQGGTVFRVQP